MTVFYIADHIIDMSRSVVTTCDTQVQVEPKVLKVLLLLAERQNEVVTHEEIMTHVWQGAEVVPNALQRCIAILRKVLGDDAKSPSVIATHPRIGYRLLAEVRWQQASPQQQNTYLQPQNARPLASVNPKNMGLSNAAITVIALCLLFVCLFFVDQYWLENQTEQYTQLRQLTKTDAHESHAIYSPNADYIVFNRYAGACKSHLWARELLSGKEWQLTAQSGEFGRPRFTQDGRELVFSARSGCDTDNKPTVEVADNAQCWSIATLDFADGLSAPQQLNARYQCQAEKLVNPVALANHQYAFLQFDKGRYQLMHFDDLNGQLTELYSAEGEYVYHFDYDAIAQHFVVISRDSQTNNMMTLVNVHGQIAQKRRIEYLPAMRRNNDVYAYFEPHGKFLLAVIHNNLYQLSLDGQLTLIQTPETALVSVAKHPQTNQLLTIRGNKDIDIAEVLIGDEQPNPTARDLNSVQLPFGSLLRTAAQERNAKYQPHGDNIAFISDRSGQDELWLWHAQQGHVFQLTKLRERQNIHDFSWSPDGQQLALVAGDQLMLFDVKGNTQAIQTKMPLYAVLSWYQDNQLLVLANDPAPGGLFLLNLDSNSLKPLNINHVDAAWMLDEQLVYSLQNGEVFSRSIAVNDASTDTDEAMPLLNGKAMFVQENAIYSVDKDDLTLKKYDKQGRFINTVMPLKPNAWKVTGMKGRNILLSQFIAINQDIVIVE